MQWPNPGILKNGDGIFPLRAAQRRVKEIKIPCESWKVQLYFPMRGLAGILKKNFPMSGKAANGEIFFSVWLLSLEWGNMIVPWMTNREFFPSPFFKMTGLTFLFSYWKLFRSATNPWKSSIWLTTESRYGFYLKLEEFENAAKLMKIWRKWIYVIPFPLGEME